MWNETKQLGIRVADHVDDLEAILSLSFERTVQREGVRLFGLRYTSPGLEKLLRRRHGKGVRYVVKVDPRDLTGVILYVDEDERWEHMACKTPDAVEGLDLQEWRDVCKLAWRMNRGTAPSRRIMLEARARLNQHAASKGAKPRKFRQQSDLDWYRENVDNPLWNVFGGGGGNDERKATRTRKPSAEPQDIRDADEFGIDEPAEDPTLRDTAPPERSTCGIDLDDPANWGEPT